MVVNLAGWVVGILVGFLFPAFFLAHRNRESVLAARVGGRRVLAGATWL